MYKALKNGTGKGSGGASAYEKGEEVPKDLIDVIKQAITMAWMKDGLKEPFVSANT